MLRRVRTAAPRWLALAIVAALAALVGPGRAVAAALPSTSFARAGAPSALLAVQQAELTASHATFGADFGWSVALSGDTALVAADGMTSAIPNVTGAAYVYTRSGTTWTLRQRLSDPDANSADTFGSSVALFGDTALVGADGATVDGESAAGAAYVYTRSGKSWSLQQKLSDPGANSADTFGSSVALFGDTALVGADGATVDGESSVGAAYVYTRSGTSWSLQTELTDPAPALGSDFGWSVALATDTALVGAPFNTVRGNCGAGAAYSSPARARAGRRRLS